MASYLSSILSVGIFSFICETIFCISKSNSSLKKVLGFITSLCIFICVALPFFSTVKSLGDNLERVNEEKEVFDENTFYSQVEKEMETRIYQNIYEEFGILCDKVCIDLSVTDNEILLNQVSLTLSGEYINESKQIQEHLKFICTEDTQITITEKQDE